MIRITRISRLQNCGVFRSFTWPSDLQDFGRYNLVYGWNGTGKTTLSRLFRNLELRTQPTTGEVTLRIGNREIKGEEFPKSNLQVRVFNRDFIQNSVFPVGGGDIPPIFVLGEENVAKQKEVEGIKEQLAGAQSKLDSASSAEQETSGEIDQFCINHAKLIKNALRSSGSNKYNNYDKASLINRQSFITHWLEFD